MNLENINKKYIIYSTIAIVVLVVVVYLLAKKKKSKPDTKVYNAEIKVSDLSYSEAEYTAMADQLATYLSDTSLLSGGWNGVDQDGVYSIFEKMQTESDLYKLISVFNGKCYTFRKTLLWSFDIKKTVMSLTEAISYLMTASERDRINQILKDKSINFSF